MIQIEQFNVLIGLLGVVTAVIGVFYARLQYIEGKAKKTDLEAIHAITSQALLGHHLEKMVTAF